MVCGGRSLQSMLHPSVDVPAIQCVSVSSIFTSQLKSLLFRGEKGILLSRNKPLCVTHTFTSQPTQACLGIPGSHFELFPFTSCSLCSLSILLDFLQVNYFCKSNYQPLCPSGSFILFPAYFLGFFLLLYPRAFLKEEKKKKNQQTACRLNCLEYLGEQQVGGHTESIFCLKISSKCLWENSAGVTICVLTYVCCGRLNPAFSASVGILSAQRVEGSALCALYGSELHSMT